MKESISRRLICFRLVVLALGIVWITGCNSSMVTSLPETGEPISITGRYVYIGNPCMTEPCLPGMAYAISTNKRDYYIVVDHIWLSENRSWGTYMPELNDIVTITGFQKEIEDIYNNPVYLLEAVSLIPAE